MLRPLFSAVVILCLFSATPCEAGRRRSVPSYPVYQYQPITRVQLKSQRVTFRQQKLASGLTLTRARTLMYSAQTAANVTGLFAPFGIIANLLGR